MATTETNSSQHTEELLKKIFRQCEENGVRFSDEQKVKIRGQLSPVLDSLGSAHTEKYIDKLADNISDKLRVGTSLFSRLIRRPTISSKKLNEINKDLLEKEGDKSLMSTLEKALERTREGLSNEKENINHVKNEKFKNSSEPSYSQAMPTPSRPAPPPLPPKPRPEFLGLKEYQAANRETARKAVSRAERDKAAVETRQRMRDVAASATRENQGVRQTTSPTPPLTTALEQKPKIVVKRLTPQEVDESRRTKGEEATRQHYYNAQGVTRASNETTTGSDALMPPKQTPRAVPTRKSQSHGKPNGYHNDGGHGGR